jgi:hypothetical protein
VILLYYAAVNLLVTREILFYCTANHSQIHPVRVVLCGNHLEANFIISGIEHTQFFPFNVFKELPLFELSGRCLIWN